jgi:hypothetical protein
MKTQTSELIGPTKRGATVKVHCDYNFVPGEKVKVTRITYGGAVYDRKGKIINSNWPGCKSVCTGVIERHCSEALFRSVAIVVCKSTDPKYSLPTFSFYPKDIGETLIVEISK